MAFHTTINEEAEDLNFDKQEFLWEQFDEYISRNAVTPYERRLLRTWVSGGHSVYENPGSRYLMDVYPPQDFLETYREDKRITQLLKGKTEEEKRRFLKSIMGYEDAEERPESTSEEIKGHVRKLEHELFYLWEYVCSEGLWSEAKEYIEDHEDDPIPFGYQG